MKTVFLIMFVSIFLTACGEQVGTAKLKVTSSMALTNSAFTGGLLIQGFGPNNAHFSKYIAYSASSPSELTVPLAYGLWNFRTIGWTGTSKFNGPVKCATASANLGSSESVVELVAETSKCDANFGDANYTNSVGNFKALEIVTCDQYHRDDGTLVSIGSDKYFCNNSSSLPASAKIWAASASIAPLNKLPTGTWSRDDANKICLTGAQGILSTNPAPALNIPTKGVPLEVTLYSSNNCLGDINILNSYHLFRGFQFDYMTDLDAKVHQDKIFVNGSTENVLFLTTSRIKRGSSSFMTLLPSIDCAGNACFALPQLPTAPAGVNFAGRSHSRYLIRKEKSLTENCDNFTWIAHAELDEAQSSCHEEEYGEDRKSIVVDLSFNQDNCGSGCDFQFKFGTGATETIRVLTVTTALNDIFHQLFYATGHHQPIPFPYVYNGLNQIFPGLSFHDEDFGKIRRIREMFLPDGPAGVLGKNITCDTSMNVDKMISFFEEGQWKTYQVVVQGRTVSGATDSIPPFICDDADSTPTACPTGVANYYDASMTVRKKVGVEFITESVMKFNCLRKLGEYENHDIEPEEKRKEIIYWNTQNDPTARFEIYSFEKEVVSGIPEMTRTEYERVEKLSSSEIRVSTSRYESRFESSTYNQRAERRDTAISWASQQIGSFKTDSTYESTTAEGPYSIFNDGVFKAEKDRDILPDVVRSPNGLRAIDFKVVGSNVVVKDVINNNLLLNFSLPGGTVITSLKASVNNSGKIAVCWINDYAGTIEGHARIYDGSVWDNLNGSPAVSGHHVDDIDCKINESDIVTVAARKRLSPPGVYPNDIEISMGPIGGAIVSTNLGSDSYKDFAIETLINGKTGLVYLKSSSLHYAQLEYTTTPFPSININDQGGTPTILSGATGYYNVEITDNSDTEPHLAFGWSTSTSQMIDVWKLSGPSLVLVKRYDSLSDTTPIPGFSNQGFDCFSFASTVYLDDDTNISANCPANMYGSFAPPVKSTYFHNNLKTLSPTVFEANFTSEAAFKIK